jgi:hypothetical protein
MRFIADGPSIPDELLISRDIGDVIFFCGAGVSQANAGLPNFEGLGRDVLRLLGAAQDSPARKLLDKALEMGRMAGVGGLLATDRVFGLLEREFEVADVRAAVAEAIRPPVGYTLNAHRIWISRLHAPELRGWSPQTSIFCSRNAIPPCRVQVRLCFLIRETIAISAASSIFTGG